MEVNERKISLPIDACVGCSACMAVCPKHCIRMIPDDKGFLRPEIDHAHCISCGSCLHVCQAENHAERNPPPSTVLAARVKDQVVLRESSSGGIAWLLAKTILSQGGIVYGAAFDERMVVKHSRITSISDLKKIQGSKYVQSDISGVYDLIKKDLRAGFHILFVGTPCQVAAIKKVFSNGNRQLLTCDLICHSVSSPLLFSEHIKAIESSTGKRIKDYRFRDKYIGWNYNMHRIVYKDGSIARHSYWTQCFKRLFFLNLIARESCYHCPYSSLSRIGDISLGDYWGIDKVSCKFADNRGVNVVFFNTELAVSFMNTIKERCLWIETDLKEALQKHLVMPCEKTEKVDAFWECYARSSYSKACDRFAGQRYYITIRNFLKDWLVKNRLIHI